MKEILDESKATLRPTRFSLYASRTTLLLVATVVFVLSGVSGYEEVIWQVYFSVGVFALNGICTLVVLITSVFALTHGEPNTGRSIVCLLFGLIVAFFWMIVITAYL